MKKIFSMIIAVTLCVSAFVVRIGAVTAPLLSGDVDYDNNISVIDATLIQRYIAELYEMDYEHEIVADFDHNGEVSVIDATWIQRSLAQMQIPENCGGWIPTDIVVNEFFAEYDSGKAVVNSPVEFTAMAHASGERVTYEFYLDGEIAQPRSENNSFVYVFKDSGEYDIEVRAYNEWGIFNEDAIHHYRVVDNYSYDEPSLTVARIMGEGSGNASVIAQATGGTAPYTYRFTILGFEWYEVTGLNDETIDTYQTYIKSHEESRWKIGEVDGMTCLYCDFEESSTIDIDMSMLPTNYYYIQVQAKDAAGNLTQIEQIEYMNDLVA